jgi:hypothetical protein
MQVKTLSVKQPYATLICAGVKRVENRTWKTDYRGRLLIHASGDHNAYPDLDCLPKKFAEKIISGKKNALIKNYDKLLDNTYFFYGENPAQNRDPHIWLKDAVKKCGFFMPAQAIIGEVTLSNIVDTLYDLDNDDVDFAEKGCCYWILTDPVLYDKPIINVMGRLRLWDFQKTA